MLTQHQGLKKFENKRLIKPTFKCKHFYFLFHFFENADWVKIKVKFHINI